MKRVKSIPKALIFVNDENLKINFEHEEILHFENKLQI